MYGSLRQIDHVDDLANEVDLKYPTFKRANVDAFDDAAQDLGGFDVVILIIEGFMQVLDLAPVQCCKVGVKGRGPF
ncbi:MAG: hypothetical protein KAI73_07925 [Rhodospirillaceae bacterium]|nr:hypothetical protein [Rhodospirillaceae bacterium]